MTGASRARAGIAAALAAPALFLGACTPSESSGGGSENDGVAGAGGDSGSLPVPGADALALRDDDDAVAALAPLPAAASAALDTSRLGEGVLPPTNRWYSSIALSDPELPIFPLPLSARILSSGVAIGLPEVAVTERTIAGAHVDRVLLDVGADAYLVTAADPVSVTVTFTRDGSEVATATLASGWPFVQVTALEPLEATLSAAPWSPAAAEPGDSGVAAAGDLVTAAVAEHSYGAVAPVVVVNDGTHATAQLELAGGESAFIWAAPPGTAAEVLAPYARPLTGVDIAAGVSPNVVSTAISYLGEGETALARLPGHGECAPGTELGAYETLLGPAPVCAGSSIAWETARVELAAWPDVSGLTGDERSELAEAVAADLDATDLAALPADTYFGTKALYRLSQLAALASQVGDPELAERSLTDLRTGIQPWLNPDGCEGMSERCFGYDSEWAGVVGLASAFGSEEFNDHHFHYGYLLHAGAVLAELDPDAVPELTPVLNALAADVAAAPGAELVPELRVFDPYRGHSWASGPSPFADGNNQESSSEAVTAWAGMALWGEASGQPAIADTGTWLASVEAQAAVEYWLAGDFPEGYEHEIVAMNWGGKRDYATWFSPEPAAMAGIQLIPMSPSATYLAALGPERIAAISEEALAGGTAAEAPQFGDYLLMFRALAGPEEARNALAEARALPAESIDGANSRSALLAGLMLAAQ